MRAELMGAEAIVATLPWRRPRRNTAPPEVPGLLCLARRALLSQTEEGRAEGDPVAGPLGADRRPEVDDVVVQRARRGDHDQTVLVRFRRGFSSFTVEVTPKRFGESLPPFDGTGVLLQGASGHDAEDVTLTGGFLEGAEARTWVALDQYEGPRLLTYSDRSRIWIRGDLTREELIEVANSLKVYGDTEKSIIPGY